MSAGAVGQHVPTGLYVKSPNGLKLRDRRVQRLVRKMTVAMPWLEPTDIPACRAWAEFEVLAGQVYAALRAMGVVNAKGEGRRLLHDYRLLRQAQAIFARELGLTPAARMALKTSGHGAEIDITARLASDAVEVGEARAVERGADADK